MKNLIKITTLITLMLLLLTNFSLGQETIKINRSRTLNLKEESQKSEVKIEITDEYNYLRIEINGHFNQGKTHLEIIDPEGNIKGQFTIKSETPAILGGKTTTTENVSASMLKSFRYPIKGDWKIKVTPTHANGNIKINIHEWHVLKLDYIGDRELK